MKKMTFKYSILVRTVPFQEKDLVSPMLARLKVFVDSGNGSKQLSNQLHFLLKIKFLEAIIHSSFIKVENRTRLEQKCCPQQELVFKLFFCFKF